MRVTSCPREKDVAAELASGHWPHAVAEELMRHSETCGRCGELVVVTVAFRQARANAVAGARLAAPGLLWWRAQIRRRNEALERVERPLVGAQIFTLLLALAAAGGLAAWEARRGLRWFWWSTDEPGGSMKAGWQAFGAEAWAQLQAMGKWDSELLVPIVLMVALLTGVACYLAFRSAGDRS